MGRPKANVETPKVDLTKVNLLFTVIVGADRGFFRPAVYLLRDGKIIDQRIGNDELLHHASQLISAYLNDYLTEYLVEPEVFFKGLEF